MTEPQRAAALRACAALYGFAIAVSLHDRFLRPAPPGQLPGLMTKLGLDAHASLHFTTTLVLLPLLFALVSRPAAAALAAARTWAQVTFAGAAAVALWTVALIRDPFWVALPAAVAMVAAVILRHFEARFTRRDIGHLDIDITIDDPKAYVKPWHAKVPVNLVADSDLIETVCENETTSGARLPVGGAVIFQALGSGGWRTAGPPRNTFLKGSAIATPFASRASWSSPTSS